MNGYIMWCSDTDRVEIVIAKSAYLARRIAVKQHKMKPMHLSIWKTIGPEAWKEVA